jgi:hypothetical protein
VPRARLCPVDARLFRDVNEQVNQLYRISPLVVVPTDELDERRGQLDARLGIENRRARVAEKVGRNDVVFGVVGASTRRRCAPPTSSNAKLGRLRRPARGGKEVV